MESIKPLYPELRIENLLNYANGAHKSPAHPSAHFSPVISLPVHFKAPKGSRSPPHGRPIRLCPDEPMRFGGGGGDKDDS